MKRFFLSPLGIIGILLFFGICGGLLGGGNYGYSQVYEFNVPQNVLIDSVKSFKEYNPHFQVPQQVNLDDDDEPSNINTFYHVYLYYKKENKIVHFHISKNKDNPRKSSINLNAVNDGLILGTWKIVNSDFGRKENLQVKKQFETTVLDKLGLEYTNKGNNMFVFWK